MAELFCNSNKTEEAIESQASSESIEEHNVHWLVYSHIHNCWDYDKEKPELVSICASYDAAKKKQKELLDQWAKDVCAEEDDIVVNYNAGRVTFKSDADSYFQVDIKEFNNK